MLCETIFHRNEKKENGNKSDYYPRTQLNDTLIAFGEGDPVIYICRSGWLKKARKQRMIKRLN